MSQADVRNANGRILVTGSGEESWVGSMSKGSEVEDSCKDPEKRDEHLTCKAQPSRTE